MTEIGKEYGTALFMLACEERAIAEYADALDKIKSAFSENPEYVEFLTSPSIPLSERLAAIRQVFGEALPEQVLSFLQLMCEKGRMNCFSQAAEEYEALLSASEHVSNAKITSAVELTAVEKQKLTAKLEAVCKGKIKAEYFIDKNLLGGLIVEMDGKIMDGSLRHRLREVKEVMKT
ncbi:MAG: ATP synthase F1 subunit delta [Eubacteriales bacterium]